MKRTIYTQLKSWKNTPDSKRKPLILEGARQVGKTWLAQEFGKREFKSCVEINFEDAEELVNVFEIDFDINRILLALQSYSGVKIVPGETLIFFDEIQYARRGLLALKYFKEKMPQYHVIAAGSLLGVIDHKNDSFPVGKVDFLEVKPLCFEEFLLAMEKDGLVELLHSADFATITAFKNQYIDLLRQYYYVGGMPEVVKCFVDERDYTLVRKVQNAILKSYEHDFSKHPPREIVKRMMLLWNSIPAQLAKENRKFVYSAIKSGARARDFETAIQWLCDAGLVYKVTRINRGELPLRGYETPDVFKLYVLDIGLHGAMSGLDSSTLVKGNDLFLQYKGALTEQFVMQELLLKVGKEIHYWSPEQSVAEMDFVIQFKGKVIPVEVKAEKNLRAKSIGVYIAQNNPETVIRTSMTDFKQGEQVTDLPLYGISVIDKIV
ncbi:MAG: ATP-binding protein [Bacteroidales bacterium]|nr:ATP-binding protein [Bacteroidales bacterium]